MLKLEKAHTDAVLPKRANPGDSGLDLCSVEEDFFMWPGETKLVSTGWKMGVPIGYEIQIRPRSGLALKNSITVGNSPGTCDANFRGIVKVILRNEHKNETFEVKKGMRIAQMVIAKVELWSPEVVNSLSETDRGSSGFGSTGI